MTFSFRIHRMSIHKQVLKIRNVTVSKGGLYTCYAKNSVGHHILTFKVYVEGTDFICMLDSFVRVDVTCQERETQ